MRVERPLDLGDLAGLRWSDTGQAALSGSLLVLARRLDRQFVRWSARWGAQEHAFPNCIAARDLERVDYLRSFPHLAVFAAGLDPCSENLRAFVDGDPVDRQGSVQATHLAPIREVLAPAACYHFYIAFSGEDLGQPLYLTTRATCFRREAEFSPLERQLSFSMREIVCIGTEQEVRALLEDGRRIIGEFVEELELPCTWQTATDPFFDPAANPKHLLQKLASTKTELVFNDRLAVASVNFHGDYFGDGFAIRRDGKVAFSGCLAFGIERWVRAILGVYGADPAGWPAPLSEALGHEG